MKKKPVCIIDDRIYTVVGINGYRQSGLTREQAIGLARRMQEQMDRAGWAGRTRVFYRDGSEVSLGDAAEEDRLCKEIDDKRVRKTPLLDGLLTCKRERKTK